MAAPALCIPMKVTRYIIRMWLMSIRDYITATGAMNKAGNPSGRAAGLKRHQLFLAAGPYLI